MLRFYFVFSLRYSYFTVEGLKQKHTYEFRVSAENKYGLSSPCEPTAPVIMKGRETKRRRGYESESRANF